MTPQLQKAHEEMDVQSMIFHLRELFDKQGRTERYETFKELFHYKMSESSLVRVHCLKMINYIKKLEKLGLEMDHELSTNLILQSIPIAFHNS